MVNYSFKKEINHEKYKEYMKENGMLIRGFDPEKLTYRVIIHRVIEKEHCDKLIEKVK